MGKSEYPRVSDLLSKIEVREQIHGLVEPKHQPSAKYKKKPKGKIERPELKVGKRVVYKIGDRWWSKTDIQGYALGIILDWETEGTFWQSTTLIVQVIRVSNPKLESMVGHLRHIEIGGYYDSPQAPMPFLVPEEGDPKDYGL